MNIDQAKQLFEEIVEICYQTENQQLIEIISQLYPEIKEANDINEIIETAAEFQVSLSEIEFLPEEEDDVQDMNDKIELMSE